MKNVEWKGYTIDELRYQRALVVIKCEIEKENLKSVVSSYQQNRLSIIGGVNSNSLMGRILGAIDIVDYSMVAFKLGRKLFSIIKNRRKG